MTITGFLAKLEIITPPRETFAEQLLRNLESMDSVISHQGYIITKDTDPDHITLISIAIRLKSKPLAFIMRSIVEEWDRDRLVRELNV